MSLYEELFRVCDEYNRFQKLGQDYSLRQIVVIFKTLLESYEDEEYDVSINEINSLIALPKDEKSKSLKLEINDLYNGDTFYKGNNRVLIFPYKIDKYIKASSFQNDMNVNYLKDFFISLVVYRYSNNLKSMEDNQLFDFLDCYLDLKKDDIIIYQEQKKKCLDEYILREKERKIEAGFMVDKYNIINNVKDFINENYDTNLDIFCEVNESPDGPSCDSSHYYLDYYRTIGLKDNDDIVFKIKELSYEAEDDIDAYRPCFSYDESKCLDKVINVYRLRNKMQDLVGKYPKLNDYFDDLNQKYRMLLKDNDIVDNKKIKKLVGNTI